MGLFANVAQHIDFCPIFHGSYIYDPVIWLKKNLFMCFYLLDKASTQCTFVIYQILDIFYDKFYGYRYIEFSKLNEYIRKALKKKFMTIVIYVDIYNSCMDNCLVNLGINK